MTHVNFCAPGTPIKIKDALYLRRSNMTMPSSKARRANDGRKMVDNTEATTMTQHGLSGDFVCVPNLKLEPNDRPTPGQTAFA